MNNEVKGFFKLIYFIGFFLLAIITAFIEKQNNNIKGVLDYILVFYFLIGGIAALIFKIPLFSKWKWFGLVQDANYGLEDTVRIVFAMLLPVYYIIALIISLIHH